MRNFERHRHRHLERDDEPTGSERMQIDACGRRDDEADEGVRDPDDDEQPHGGGSTTDLRLQQDTGEQCQEPGGEIAIHDQ